MCRQGRTLAQITHEFRQPDRVRLRKFAQEASPHSDAIIYSFVGNAQEQCLFGAGNEQTIKRKLNVFAIENHVEFR